MISIPKPCHENWNEMTPKAQGRLCDKCCKVVIDFTNKTTNQIADFISANSANKVCGRFRNDQIVVPVPLTVQPRRIPRIKLFVAALYFVFGGMLFSSCHKKTEVMGKMQAPGYHSSNFTPQADTPYSRPRDPQVQQKQPATQPDYKYVKGKVKFDPKDTAKKAPVICKTKPDTVENIRMTVGEIYYEPDTAK
jgi:hypothetical protein